jgi:Xaa-Pro aminopeptidase
MLSHEKGTHLKTLLERKNSTLVHPRQNLVDLIWKDKPSRSKELIYVQESNYMVREAADKLAELRAWVRAQPPAVPPYSKAVPTQQHKHIGTLVTSLPCIGR